MKDCSCRMHKFFVGVYKTQRFGRERRRQIQFFLLTIVEIEILLKHTLNFFRNFLVNIYYFVHSYYEFLHVIYIRTIYVRED